MKPPTLDPLPRRGAAKLDDDEFQALDGMARSLTASGWYRVVRRFERRDRYADDDGSEKRLALYVDVETTGIDQARDRIIEVGAVLFEYGVQDGRIFALRDSYSALEDPGRPIPENVVAMTGITDEMAAGQRIDDDVLHRLVDQAGLIVAHNAQFDRGFLERRMSVFGSKPWACSSADVPWRDHGCASSSLEYLLYRHCAEFYDAHRALNDCLAGVHALATPTVNGALPFALLLESARRPMARIWAIGAPIESRDKLKSRRYRWNPGDDGRPRSWHIQLPADQADTECAWLRDNCYSDRSNEIRVERISPTERYSSTR
jgi:DNA polymerase-3 subunit epsilon